MSGVIHRTCLAATLASAAATAAAAPVVFSASGGNPAGVQGTVDGFRSALGAHREINWDGVPDFLAAPNDLPPNFFNVNSPRGVVFSTPGTGFRVSANAANPSGAAIEFGDINPIYPTLFATFSPQRLFTPIGSNVTDVSFFLPGTTVAALVSGFGAVFTDVDLAGVTSIQYFDALGASLGTWFALPGTAADETLSFLGVYFSEGPVVSRVRITAGNQILGPGNTANDLVVMDDFIYGEPTLAADPAVPEPGTLALLTLGGLGFAGRAIRRRKAATA